MDRPLTDNNQIQVVTRNNLQVPHETIEIDSKFTEEAQYLEKIKWKLNNALKNYEDTVKQYDQDYKNSKHYLVNHFHEIDPTEIFQNELAMKQIEREGIHTVQMRDRIARLAVSPYFARIDFCEEQDQEFSVYYIGSFSYFDKEQTKIIIYDWRAPISSMFYDSELGFTGYDAPMGRVTGELSRKRQLKISQGKLEYVLDSAINIQDDVLQRELSHTSDEKMKTIISTIQKEQNLIIRNEKADTLIIQGVAGSGKTSIALHRIAYLLYRYKETLTAKNVVILSPNKVFADYISNVLPELGEEPIYEMSFLDIAEIQLEGIIQFEPDKDPLETDDPAWSDRVRFKSGIDFVNCMNQYLSHAVSSCFEPVDLEFEYFAANKEWILARYHAYENYSVKRRLQEVSLDIYEKFCTDNIRGRDLPKQKQILKKLLEMCKIKNTLELYKDFYQTMNLTDKFVMPNKKTLEWSDVYPFMYFHAAFEGLKDNRLIKHLVIDEMQDYTPVQYAVMNKLFNCKKTILGDFGQALHPNHVHTLKDLRDIYHNAELVELNKSYRSTYEIINFAKQIQDTVKLEPIERHGDIPELIACRDKKEELIQVREKINVFQQSGNTTLGIILKTNSEAKELYQLLSKDYEMQLITPDSIRFENGITVTSIQMSKGLEFDEVLVLSVDQATYHTEYDRKLLYIACTRAMHSLSLVYSGKLTRLIKEV